ncbi:uncharacterized protein V1516DRAFT_617171, partial [Lipomyces oligophaga]|uniref:uncharacterized protein n=1 Tax=Lipomyces oligophaga TaxID=45792 RepID=UPI0034CF0338
AVALRQFMLVDSQLEDSDRVALSRALWHINVGSLVSGSALSAYMALNFFRKSMLALRLVGRAGFGVAGFYAGSQVGMWAGTDAVSRKFRRSTANGETRPACSAAMELVANTPQISKWQRYFAGERRLMVDLI